MKQPSSLKSELEIERYLYGEMTDEERNSAEESFFDDDALFYEVLNLENELVDRYARGKLVGAELVRFERSLENLPARRAKVANAVALADFIADERPQAQTIAADVSAKQTFGRKLAQFFSPKNPALVYATLGLFLFFAASSVFLLLDNRRQSNELARFQTERAGDSRQKEIDLENRLKDSQRRAADLQNQIDAERSASGDLTDELARERERRERIEADIERLRRENAVRPTPAAREEEQQAAPIIASVLLAPSITTRRGVAAAGAKTVSLERETKRVAVRLALPEAAKTSERFSVGLNGKIAAENLAALGSSGGRRAVQLTVSANDLLDGANELTVTNQAGEPVSRYVFNARKK